MNRSSFSVFIQLFTILLIIDFFGPWSRFTIFVSILQISTGLLFVNDNMKTNFHVSVTISLQPM